MGSRIVAGSITRRSRRELSRVGPTRGSNGRTGIFYAQGVKANVIFFDRKPGAKEPWTTLKERRMVRPDLDEFVECYHPQNRHQPNPS